MCFYYSLCPNDFAASNYIIGSLQFEMRNYQISAEGISNDLIDCNNGSNKCDHIFSLSNNEGILINELIERRVYSNLGASKILFFF